MLRMPSTAARALALSLGALSLGATARAASPATSSSTKSAAAPSTTEGHVRFVTDARAYLDRGADDGLGRGQTVSIVRAGVAVTSCLVDAVGDHAATCHAALARGGDGFVTTRRRGAPPATAPVAALPPPTDARVERERARGLADAPVTRVDFHPRARRASGGSAEVAAGVTMGLARGAGASWAATEVDVHLGHVPLGADLRLDLALSAVRWAPADARFRPDTPMQLYLWEAEVSHRELDARTVLSAGRLWPWHVPGVPLLDGVQLGRRTEDHAVEAGVYGGLLPSMLSLSPELDQWTAGVYAALARAGTRGDTVGFSRVEARVATRRSPTIGDVREAEVLGALTLAALSATGGGRLRDAPSVDHAPVLETAHAGLALRPRAGGGAWVELRHLGVAPEVQPLLVSETPAARGGLHAAGAAWLDLFGDVGAGASGGWHLDRDTNRHQEDAALELRLPRLFGDVAGLWLGATLAQGWLWSRGGYLQVASRWSPRLQLVARVSANAIRYAPTGAPGDFASSNELGGALHLQARLAARLRLRARMLARLPFAERGLPAVGTTPATLVTSLELVATF